MKFRHSVFLVLSALTLSAYCVPVAAAPSFLDERFLVARDAVRLGERAKLERIAPELKGHELEAYIEYWQLLLDLKSAEPARIKAFLNRQDKTYVAERLRSDWLKQLGKAQDWAAFDAEYPQMIKPDQDLMCFALQSRRARGDQTALDEALPLWLNLIEPTESCYPLLEALIVEKRVLADEVWARVRRQFEANKLAAARYTMNYLPASQTPQSSVVSDIIDRPVPWLVNLPKNALNTRMNRELAALAIARIARNDPRMAADQLNKIASQLQANELAWAWTQVGWWAAQRHMADALAWYKNADDASMSDEVVQWKVRAALRAGNWGAVRSTIEKMPPAMAGQETWTYWLARAYRAGGRLDEANTLLLKISGQPNFYSNLADEELGRPIVVPEKAVIKREEIARVAEHVGIQRSLALFRVGLRTEGVKEWNWSLQGMSDRELLAAASIAQRASVFDRAISAADRTKLEHDYSLRYLAPFSEEVRVAAKKQSLDDAWVYGLMRQESRFVTNAKSTVGASGLMQLMPATAKWVAQKIGLKDFSHSQVNDTEVNLLLGTSYMRMVMESLDNSPVLASAAYNAGPGRARKWRADQPLEGAIYAESIPFNETRDYVKKVMSNSVYYSALFEGKPQTIKSRLGVIGPRTTAEAKGEDLP